jgi:hypothetical protein
MTAIKDERIIAKFPTELNISSLLKQENNTALLPLD